MLFLWGIMERDDDEKWLADDKATYYSLSTDLNDYISVTVKQLSDVDILPTDGRIRRLPTLS